VDSVRSKRSVYDQSNLWVDAATLDFAAASGLISGMDQEEFFTSPLSGYFTMKDIAVKLRVSIPQIRKIVETKRISHNARHGVVRLWTHDDVREITLYLVDSLEAVR
jgi:hypothetical protein